MKPLRLFAVGALLLVVLAACAPRYVQRDIPNLERVPSEELYRFTLSWFTLSGYTITVSDSRSGLISGVYRAGQYSYNAQVQILPLGETQRFLFRFDLAAHGNNYLESVESWVTSNFP